MMSNTPPSDHGTSICIYVAYHQPGPHPTAVEGYQAICNVAPGSVRPAGFDHYDVPSGCPDRNTAYCELSGFHALLGERTEDWLGLVHYRRIFTSRRDLGIAGRFPQYRRLRHFDWADPSRYGAGTEQLLGELPPGINWVSAPKMDTRSMGFRSLAHQYAAEHIVGPLEICDALLQERYPERQRLMDYLEKTQQFRPFNMVLARRSLLLDYGQFLFDVIDNTFDAWPSSASGRDPRWPGYLAERLLNYWLDVVAPSGVVEHALPVLLLHNSVIQNTRAPEQKPSTGPEVNLGGQRVAAALGRLPGPLRYPAHAVENFVSSLVRQLP